MESVTCKAHPDAIVYENPEMGERICTECGVVLEETLANNGADCSTTENDIFSSNINPSCDDELKSTCKEFNTYTKRKKMNTDDMPLNTVEMLMQECAIKLGCGRPMIDVALLKYKTVQTFTNIKPSKIESFVGACLYLACQDSFCPRPIREVASAIGHSNPQKINKARTDMERASVSIPNSGNARICTGEIHATEIIPRYCEMLGMPFRIIKLANHIAKQAYCNSAIVGRSPVSIAAIAIYMASQTTKNAKSVNEISETTGVSKSTIMKLSLILYPDRSKLLPKDYVP